MRQFVLDNQSVKNGLIVICGKDFRYLRQVLRVKVGDMLNVRFTDGSLQGTTVAQIDENAKKITLQICDSKETSITRGVQANQIDDSFTKYQYVLFQFIPKPQKFEQIVRQATECGVNVIVPVIGEYSEKSSVASLQGAKQERLERIIKEARQQSGSPVNTQVEKPMTLEEAVAFWQNFTGDEENSKGFVLSERTEDCVSLHNTLGEGSDVGKVAVAVGSEGGISPAEITFLKEKGLFSPIHFAVNILRCETAALYGIAAIQTALNKS